jgi:hypothetical protein
MSFTRLLVPVTGTDETALEMSADVTGHKVVLNIHDSDSHAITAQYQIPLESWHILAGDVRTQNIKMKDGEL